MKKAFHTETTTDGKIISYCYEENYPYNTETNDVEVIILQ